MQVVRFHIEVGNGTDRIFAGSNPAIPAKTKTALNTDGLKTTGNVKVLPKVGHSTTNVE